MDAGSDFSAWFAGPKAENGEWFSQAINRILQDYYYWRRNYYPEDGVVIDSHQRRDEASFFDAFDDRLLELLSRLKAHFPFHNPRYAGHMLSEQTLPSIAGFFAAMLYNPNNVTHEAAPVTLRLELEAAQMIAEMLGHTDQPWAHITSGGTIANFEALWMARTVKYLPLVVSEMRESLGLPPREVPFGALPELVMNEFAAIFREMPNRTQEVIQAYLHAPSNVVEYGLDAVISRLDSRPIVLAPESHHYCFQKAMDLLGFGRRSLLTIPVDSEFRMIPHELGRRIEEVEARGDHVLAVVAVVGSTEEGAIDPVNEILDLRSQRAADGKSSFWLHADAAYGGYLRTLTLPKRVGLGDPTTTVFVNGSQKTIDLHLPERSACDALERLGECDSITIDPHKLGYIPYPAGAISFRSSIVKPLARQTAPYLEDEAEDVDSERSSNRIGVYILEGSKPGASAAAVWLSHKLIPLDATGHGKLIRETVRNASELTALLENYPDWVGPQEVRAVTLCQPGSNIVCYAFRPEKPTSLDAINQLNRKLYSRFSLTEHAEKHVYDQRFFASRTTISPAQYSAATVQSFLDRLGVTVEEYERSGVFLLRSVLMSPWYSAAKLKGRFFLSEYVAELFSEASLLVKEG